ncbi:hypothetical protein H2201_000287 [Coniosporium apollinis]|uniref:DNA2/NAM7 helicase-like C-terminal domain-containing protein n=2 Tax=Coniosporium TaxID=2810619 RepID=A0ABQ9P4A6_9PEZI|nr:hypothetical protein H2199_003476 [Cladosporium sp. JES 115]KAJ9669420.1 hypothetical protein H2201_000287 [Coniosporium apollinis]
MGKDLKTSFESRRKAQKRITECRLVFTTCIGASLGLLRGEKFEIVLIDEASQQIEAMSLVPLVKGCERAVLVGDHVKLRATIRNHAKLVNFDISLFERMYGEHDRPEVCKVMLDTQYRMHRDVCSFSSTEFHGGVLATAVPDNSRPLPPSEFPWPASTANNGGRKVFIQCSNTEDLGRQSKSNRGQANLCRDVCKLLSTSNDQKERPVKPSIVVLTPYTRQIELLRGMLLEVEIFSIDGFQGREADIVVFVTVRCNEHKEMGFLKDLRRLNVAMTRAKAGVIIIGDQSTLSGGDDEVSAAVWKRLIGSCTLVKLEDPMA